MAKKIASSDNILSALSKLGCEITADLNKDMPYFLSTGSPALDIILTEKGGLTTGCVEVFGPEGAGKSSFALATMAQAIKSEMHCFYINMERSITKSLVDCFLDHTKVHWIKPEHGQAAFNGMEHILRTMPRSFIVLDSVPACISSAQLEEGAEKEMYAPIPKLLSTFMPKAKIFTEHNESTIMFLNQIRDNLTGYGAKHIVPGGQSIKFNNDWRIELKRTKKLQKNQDGPVYGHIVKATTVKNRFFAPYQEAILYLIYGKGFNAGLEVADLAMQLSLIKRSGAWYEIPGVDEKIQGFDNLGDYLVSHSDIMSTILEKIKKIV